MSFLLPPNTCLYWWGAEHCMSKKIFLSKAAISLKSEELFCQGIIRYESYLYFVTCFFPSVQCISISGACLAEKCNYKFVYLLWINNEANYMLLDHGHRLLIFLLSTQIWLSETSHIWGIWAFSRKRMEGIAWRLYYDHGLLIFLLLTPQNFAC